SYTTLPRERRVITEIGTYCSIGAVPSGRFHKNGVAIKVLPPVLAPWMSVRLRKRTTLKTEGKRKKSYGARS
ncbi:hypothetical protein L9F63_019779, partial [Diploptera punctata]